MATQLKLTIFGGGAFFTLTFVYMIAATIIA
jgi:hypothetical protein